MGILVAWHGQEGAGPGTLYVQASLLVLHDPAAPSLSMAPLAQDSAASASPAPPLANAGPSRGRVAARPAPLAQRLPASTWNAMSALAGSASPSLSCCSAWCDIGCWSELPCFLLGSNDLQCSFDNKGCHDRGRCLPASELRKLYSTRREKYWLNLYAGGTARHPPLQTQPAAVAPLTGTQQQQMASGSEMEPDIASRGELVTVGDYLADSLTAQSLDLPPAAAKAGPPPFSPVCPACASGRPPPCACSSRTAGCGMFSSEAGQSL